MPKTLVSGVGRGGGEAPRPRPERGGAPAPPVDGEDGGWGARGGGGGRGGRWGKRPRAVVRAEGGGFPRRMTKAPHRLKVGEGLPGLALQQEAPIVVEHLSQHPTLANSRLQQEGY